MANTAKKLLDIARAEIGYKEKKTNADLYDKEKNAGKNNYTKYAKELDDIKYYESKVLLNGYAWCTMFVDWCSVKAYGANSARDIFCRPAIGNYSQDCTYARRYFIYANRFSNEPVEGAQIFFWGDKSKGLIAHTGIVEYYDTNTVHTIEGNTSDMVARREYSRADAKIAGYGLPWYETEEQPKKTVEEVAQEVLSGKWGNGTERKAKIESAGYSYAEVQEIVNKLVKGENIKPAPKEPKTLKFEIDPTKYSKIELILTEKEV